METENVSRVKLINNLLWSLIIFMISGGVLFNYYLREISWPLRFVGWLILVGIVVFLVFKTIKGKQFFSFAKSAKIELYKVVWPIREEAVKITCVIAALVVVTSFVIWGVDAILLKSIGWLIMFLTNA